MPAADHAIHKFEKAGLGKAPFRLIGYERKVGPIRIEAPGAMCEVLVGAPGQPMGSCDFCGQGIADCFVIESSDRRQFIVGSDCVYKTGDAGLVKGTAPHKREADRAKRTARAEAVQAELRQILDDAEVTKRLQALPHPRGFTGLSFLEYADWMAVRAGASGRERVLREIKRAIA